MSKLIRLAPALLLAGPAAAQAPQFTQGGITLLQDPAAVTDATRKGYVDALVAAARAASVPATMLGQPGGPARLGANGTLPIAQLPVGTAAGTVAAGDALAAVQAAAAAAQAKANLAAPAASLAPVATSGAYADLTGRPVIPVVPTLSPVATSGAYGDLTGRPTIPVVPPVGTAAGTLAAGNDARITGAVQAAGGTMTGALTLPQVNLGGASWPSRGRTGRATAG